MSISASHKPAVFCVLAFGLAIAVRLAVPFVGSASLPLDIGGEGGFIMIIGLLIIDAMLVLKLRNRAQVTLAP